MKSPNEKLDPICWLTDARGVYLPKDFAISFIVDRSRHVKNVSAETWEILEAGPDHPDYWDEWAKVLDNAVVTDEHGREWTVYQDGDCWLVPIGMEWDEESDWFAWPKAE